MTEEQLQQIAPKLDFGTTSRLFKQYEVNTPKRQAMFLAQCAHESNSFSVTQENLNYSANGLRTVFPKYFKTDQEAEAYARKPERIANRVYGNRMGNGDEESGDGYRFRGRGYIQLTGKNNYSAFAKSLNISLDDAVRLCETPEGALQSALYFWQRENLNKYADSADVTTCTKKINGGTNGLNDRIAKFDKFLKILS